ncbi:hypothetical protein FQA39_LY14658 [Lamprigera yunnana]|nr:hypothetical protein FQA39_LY14658 [Lamprigera yunnana]
MERWAEYFEEVLNGGEQREQEQYGLEREEVKQEVEVPTYQELQNVIMAHVTYLQMCFMKVVCDQMSKKGIISLVGCLASVTLRWICAIKRSSLMLTVKPLGRDVNVPVSIFQEKESVDFS